MASILEKTLFEKYINENFVEKLCMLLFIDRDIKEVTIKTFLDFLKEQIALLKEIRREAAVKYGTKFDEKVFEEAIKKDEKYKLLLFVKEVLLLRLEKENIFFSDNTVFYSLIQDIPPKLLNLIDKILKEKDKVLFEYDKEKQSQLKRALLRDIFNIIEIWNEIKAVKDVIKNYDNLISLIKENKISSIYSTISKFKEIVFNAHVKFIESASLSVDERNDTYEKLSLVSFSKDEIKKSVANYVFESYQIYKTNYSFIDDYIDGFESENVYIICAPSNHGKSLLMLQLAKGLMQANDFKENDAILFITLEDNRIKLSRRIFTIFGNFSPSSIKRLYICAHNKAQKLKETNPEKLDLFRAHFEHILENIYLSSIKNITKENINFLVQDRADSNYSISDLLQTITLLKLKNINVKAVFIDYIDLMTSSKKFESDYNEQGQIVKDLRAIAKEFHIPIITATQLQRDAEDVKKPLSNKLMGDSYKKVRNADYILMIRQLIEENIESLNEIYNLTTKLNKYQVEEISKHIFPVEFAFTKVKDTDKVLKDNSKLMFAKFNLSLYDDPIKLYEDFEESKEKNLIIERFIKSINEF